MKKLFIILIVIGLFGCSDPNNNSQSIIGVWEGQNCISVSIEDVQSGYVKDYYEFNSDSTFYQEVKFYNSQECDSEDYSLATYNGTYTIGEKALAESGESVTKIDLIFPCPAGSIDCSPETFSYVFYIEDDILIFGTQAGDTDGYALYSENTFLKID